MLLLFHYFLHHLSTACSLRGSLTVRYSSLQHKSANIRLQIIAFVSIL